VKKTVFIVPLLYQRKNFNFLAEWPTGQDRRVSHGMELGIGDREKRGFGKIIKNKIANYTTLKLPPL